MGSNSLLFVRPWFSTTSGSRVSKLNHLCCPPLASQVNRRSESPQTSSSKLSSLEELRLALKQWQEITQNSPNHLPNDLHIRRCSVAQSLHLSSLIIKAGGHQIVRRELNLSPLETYRQASRIQEISRIAVEVQKLCEIHSLPPPTVAVPSIHFIRTHKPTLANRIFAYPSRSGYQSLVRYFNPSTSAPKLSPQTESPNSKQCEQRINADRSIRRVRCLDPEMILLQLLKYQSHPKVMPPLKTLPSALSGAIQRQGGSQRFALDHCLVQFKNYKNSLRLRNVARWLSTDACSVPPYSSLNPVISEYLNFVHTQSQNPPKFPLSRNIPSGILNDIYRLGGKRTLALRLGYGQCDRLPGLFMGPFSVQFSADILDYALDNITVAADGCVGMPKNQSLKSQPHLAAGVQLFGGNDIVGRRLGLVPFPSHDAEAVDACIQ